MTKKIEEVRHLGEKKRPVEKEQAVYDRDYSRYAFSYPTDKYKYVLKPGLSREVIEEISAIKNEPKWMREFRLKAYEIFLKKPMPTWGGDLSHINFDTITYYATPTDKGARSWEDVPEEVKKTFDRLGIPEAERKFLAGVGAQYDSEVVYHSIREDLAKKGVIFLSMDEGLREYPDLVKEYFGTVIPPTDNKFAALNSAVWSGGSFIYVPKGVHVEIPLQAYFRINAPQMGQFERTLIIADEGARVHYIEGCLPGGEQVSVGDRWVNIESLKPGDYVIADNGEKARVRATMVRRYRGEMLTIKPISPYNAFRLTPEHPVLVVRRSRVLQRRKPRNGWLPEVDTEKLFTAQPEYVPAGELTVGDFLVFPKVQAHNYNPRYSPELLKLLGYYLAEGSAFIHKTLNVPVVSFSFGAHEKEVITEVCDLITKITGKDAYVTELKGRYAVNVTVYSQELFDVCTSSCGTGASSKRLSDELMALPPEQIEPLLTAYFVGDGNVCDKGNSVMYRAATASETLAQQIQELLARKGIYASIHVRPGGDDTINGRKIHRKDQYIIVYTADKRWSEIRQTDRYFLVPIKEIERAPYDGFVFNLDVEGPSSYLVRGFAVHNCTAPIYSKESLHAAVVELIAKRGAHLRYTTLQNWSNDVYNLVTKRAVAYEDATVEWVDANIGCLTADTKVFLNPRGAVNITEVKPNDWIYALDLNTMEIVKRPVKGIVCTGVKPVFKLITENYREIKATANHPFLALYRSEKHWHLVWKPLEQLQVGDLIAIIDELPPKEGKPAEFVRIKALEPLGEEAVYDIEVEGAHNFIANGLIVHNSRLTMKYPSVYMLGKGARADILSVAFAGKGQHQDTGGKAIHAAPYTTSTIVSKSVSKDGGRATYRGQLVVAKGAHHAKSNVRCDALILDEYSRSDTYPYIEIDEDQVTIGHEATVGKVGDDQIFYLMSRGLSESEALSMIVLGFMEPFTKTLPMEYAIEFNRLIQLEMEGSVG
jgi:Fe-S cluster assembly protein SufB